MADLVAIDLDGDDFFFDSKAADVFSGNIWQTGEHWRVYVLKANGRCFLEEWLDFVQHPELDRLQEIKPGSAARKLIAGGYAIPSALRARLKKQNRVANGELNSLDSQQEKPTKPQRKARPCQSRDHLWLTWYEDSSQKTFNSYPEIRDKWNTLSDEERAEHECRGKLAKGNSGWDVVRKGIEKAIEERRRESET